ncbi:nuclear polyadenylated RNA-binding protein [Anaeramoeba flamelloides]|uniref:Nuclear polyadenylated RNA-binding protein n=1 Tax=Anaeramoeba flamelloides TaxID=1746091 RepID=A0AAV7YDT8_9EUKA|nr:nuclear polyadenylated RNA-binding protein [Anaeramoeba flamelloides]
MSKTSKTKKSKVSPKNNKQSFTEKLSKQTLSTDFGVYEGDVLDKTKKNPISRDRKSDRKVGKKREPQKISGKGAKLFIGGLPGLETDKETITKEFKKYGEIAELLLKQTYGFLQFTKRESAQRAVKGSQQFMIGNKKIKVEFCRDDERQKRRNSNNSNDSRQSSYENGSDRRRRGGRGGRGGGSSRDNYHVNIRDNRFNREKKRDHSNNRGGGYSSRSRVNNYNQNYRDNNSSDYNTNRNNRVFDNDYNRNYNYNDNRFNSDNRVRDYGNRNYGGGSSRGGFNRKRPFGNNYSNDGFGFKKKSDQNIKFERKGRKDRPQPPATKRGIRIVIESNDLRASAGSLKNSLLRNINILVQYEIVPPNTNVYELVDEGKVMGYRYIIIMWKRFQNDRPLTLKVVHPNGFVTTKDGFTVDSVIDHIKKHDQESKNSYQQRQNNFNNNNMIPNQQFNTFQSPPPFSFQQQNFQNVPNQQIAFPQNIDQNQMMNNYQMPSNQPYPNIPQQQFQTQQPFVQQQPRQQPLPQQQPFIPQQQPFVQQQPQQQPRQQPMVMNQQQIPINTQNNQFIQQSQKPAFQNTNQKQNSTTLNQQQTQQPLKQPRIQQQPRLNQQGQKFVHQTTNNGNTLQQLNQLNKQLNQQKKPSSQQQFNQYSQQQRTKNTNQQQLYNNSHPQLQQIKMNINSVTQPNVTPSTITKTTPITQQKMMGMNSYSTPSNSPFSNTVQNQNKFQPQTNQSLRNQYQPVQQNLFSKPMQNKWHTFDK